MWSTHLPLSARSQKSSSFCASSSLLQLCCQLCLCKFITPKVAKSILKPGLEISCAEQFVDQQPPRPPSSLIVRECIAKRDNCSLLKRNPPPASYDILCDCIGEFHLDDSPLYNEEINVGITRHNQFHPTRCYLIIPH